MQPQTSLQIRDTLRPQLSLQRSRPAGLLGTSNATHTAPLAGARQVVADLPVPRTKQGWTCSCTSMVLSCMG
jgi:hypothetical protein